MGANIDQFASLRAQVCSFDKITVSCAFPQQDSSAPQWANCRQFYPQKTGGFSAQSNSRTDPASHPDLTPAALSSSAFTALSRICFSAECFYSALRFLFTPAH